MRKSWRSGVVLALAVVVGMWAGCAEGSDEEEYSLPVGSRVAEDFASQLRVDLTQMDMRPSGLYVQDEREGDGVRAETGDVVTVHYTGWLPTGREFDSSRGGDPFSLRLGEGRVIEGWEEGLAGMREGGQRRLVIPPSLAYGERSVGPIPANATLVFDVELVEVEDRTPEASGS